MKHNNVIYSSALLLTLIMTAILTVFAGAAAEEIRTASRRMESDVSLESSDTAISNQIIINATHYLNLTSCENIDVVPEAATAVEPVPRMVIDLSDDDIYLIACQVFVEAGAEPYDAQVGVANVIINRVLSSLFPNTVTEVLYQEGQFPPAYNGILDRVKANGPGDQAMQATMDALHGKSTVGDYLFFNMASGVNTAACSRYMRIGDTTFYMQ